jgi:AhpD family alkylhydroperoxidase
MSLVALAELDSLEGLPREVAESGLAQYGQLLNTWKAIMNKPDMFAAYLPFLRQVAGPGELDPVLKDVVALYVAYLNNCRYSASHRSTSARAKGVTDETMQHAVSGDWSGFDSRTQHALTFAKELTLLPSQVSYSELPQAVLPETLAAVRADFSDVELLELCMSVAMWNALARFHRVMDFEFDMPEAPEGVNPK